jgi:hypothetical protein
MAVATSAKAAKSDYVSSPIELLKLSAKAIQVNLGTAIAVFAAVLGAGLLAATIFGFLVTRGPMFALLLLILVPLLILALAMSVGTIFAVIMLASARGEKLTFQQAWAYVNSHGWRVLGVSVLGGLAIIGGLILLIIPGLIFAAWFSLAPYVVLEEDAKPIEALKRSKDLVSGHVIEMWGAFGLTSAASVVLSVIPVLGPIVAFVLAVLYAPATAIRYLQLKELKASGKPAPPIDPWNYVVIAVLIFGGFLVQSLTHTPVPGMPFYRST